MRAPRGGRQVGCGARRAHPGAHWLGRRALLHVLGIALGLLVVAAPSHAWKPVTHVYLAEIALRDAVDDGKVTFYVTDPSKGFLKRDASGNPVVLGEYQVRPEILEALRAYPSYYRAGVFGPDAYPDILTGQQLIHPAGRVTPGENADDLNQGGPGSDPWLRHLWDLAFGTEGTTDDRSPQARAFVTGYLTHAAGDLYAHTFINHYSGGAFHFVENAAKHILLEGYLAKRMPRLDSWEVSVDGLEDLIYRDLVYAAPGSPLEGLLTGDNRRLSVPAVYSRLRAQLQSEVDAYVAKLAAYDARISALVKAANDCAVFDFSCSKILLYAQAGALGVERTAYAVANGPIAAYKEAWRDDIDDGLRAWPRLSHELALALFFTPPAPGERFGKMNLDHAKELAHDYALLHLLSMAGAPDFVGLTAFQVGRLVDAVEDAIGIPILKQAIKDIEKDLFNYLLQSTFGVSLDELKEYLESPELSFDKVMNNPSLNSSGGALVSLEDMNQRELHLKDTGFSNPEDPETWDWTVFAPAYNTVTLTKLLYLSPSEVQRLLRDLGSSVVFDGDNPMLGFAETLDGSNQWQANPQKMVIARDCVAYQKLFLPQTGAAPCGLPALSLDPPEARVTQGEGVTLTVSPLEPVTWELSPSLQGAASEELSAGTLRYTAPKEVAGSHDVTVRATATDGSGRQALGRITVSEAQSADSGGGFGLGLSSDGLSFTWTGEGDGENWTDPCNWYRKGGCQERWPGSDPDKDDTAVIPQEDRTDFIHLSQEIKLGSLQVNKGALLDGGTILIKRYAQWTGGTIYNTLHVAEGARLQIGGEEISVSLGKPGGAAPLDPLYLRAYSSGVGTILNEGDLVWTSGDLSLGNDATIVNRGRLYVKTVVGKMTGSCCVTHNTLVNEGELVMAQAPTFGGTLPGDLGIPLGDTGQTLVVKNPVSPEVTLGVTTPSQLTLDGVALLNRGRVILQKGTLLNLAMGNHESHDGCSFVGPGLARVTGDLHLEGTTTLSDRAVLELAKGGTLGGTGTLAGTSTFRWTGGTVYATMTVAKSLSMEMGGLDRKEINSSLGGGVLVNEGTAVWTGAEDTLSYRGQSALTNRGTFVVLNTVHLEGDCCLTRNAFTNEGALVVGDGGPDNPASVTLEGVGLVTSGRTAVRSGSLTLGKGHHELLPGARFSGPGSVRITGESVTLGGGVTLERGAVLELAPGPSQPGGVIDGAGTLSGDGRFVWSGGTLRGSVTLAPGLTSTLSDDGDHRLLSPDGKTGGLLTNQGSLSWTGKGRLILSVPGGFVNGPQGRLEVTGDVTVAGPSCCTTPYALVNQGAFVQLRGSTTFASAFLRNTGTLEVAGALRFDGSGGLPSYTQMDGVTRLQGGSLETPTRLELLGGLLTGEGTLSGTLANSARVEPGSPIGTLRVVGAYQQSTQGILALELGGPGAGQSDRLEVTGPASLAGVLWVGTIQGYRPAQGDRLGVASWTSHSGSFGKVQSPAGGPGFTAEYAADGLTLLAGSTQTIEPGDANGDGKVTVADALLALRIVAGQVSPTPQQLVAADVAPRGSGGRPYGDGKLDVADVIRILRHVAGLETTWP